MRELALLAGFWMILFPISCATCDEWREVPSRAGISAVVVLWVAAIGHLLQFGGLK